jgi:diphthine-ammonia ligase
MPSPHPLPGVKHKVIGLVSGGKDSTFNLLHCVANGHELVALATLTPEAGVGESTAYGTVLEQSRSIDPG